MIREVRNFFCLCSNLISPNLSSRLVSFIPVVVIFSETALLKYRHIKMLNHNLKG